MSLTAKSLAPPIGKRNMLKLFLSPGSSSMAPHIALHEIGAEAAAPHIAERGLLHK
jgi:hypothetical protein